MIATIRYALYTLIIGLLLGYFKGCSDEHARGVSFKAGVEAVGKAQEERSAAIGKANRQRKENADAENTKSRANYAALLRKLRAQRSSGSFVPAASSGAKCPELAPVPRVDLEGALRSLDAGVQRLLEEGDACRIDLNSVKKWAHENPTGKSR